MVNCFLNVVPWRLQDMNAYYNNNNIVVLCANNNLNLIIH